MRELAVRLRFTSHCLGNDCKHYHVGGKMRNHYLLPRSPNGKVIFMTTWWQHILNMAAGILCQHHSEVRKIRFGMEVEGTPRPLTTVEETDPNTGQTYKALRGHFLRYYQEDRFVQHEAFFPGDVITVTCVVPESISDEDFYQLMVYAGKYCGISPSQPNKFGFFTVESVRPTGIGRTPRPKEVTEDTCEIPKSEPSGVTST